MRVVLVDNEPSVTLSVSERATLSRAFSVLEQGAFHFREVPGNAYSVAAESLRDILREEAADAVDEQA